MAVLSMSKQEFTRLEVPLRVQSGGLRISDACVLIGIKRRQVFRLLRGLRQDGGRRPCFPNAAADPATIGSLLRFTPWCCRSCASDMPTLARPLPAQGLRLWWRRSYTRPRGGSTLSISDRSRSQIAPSASAVVLASSFCGSAFSHVR
jgi:hypothetical protein